MLRAVLDVNVLVSAVLSATGAPAQLLRAWRDGEFELVRQRIVAERHSRLLLQTQGVQVDAMLFGCCAPLPVRLSATYRLGLDDYQGARRLQLTIEHWKALA